MNATSPTGTGWRGLASVNRSHKYNRLAANAAGKQAGYSSANLGDCRVSDNDGPANRECGLICHMAYITVGFRLQQKLMTLNDLEHQFTALSSVLCVLLPNGCG